MLKEMLKYVVDMSVPHFHELGNQLFADKELKRVSYNPKAEPIRMTTLSSLVHYIKSNVDIYKAIGSGKSFPDLAGEYLNMLIHVVSPTEVFLYSPLDEERKRENMVQVTASVPKFKFNEFMDKESFIIGVQAKFLGGPDNKINDKELLLSFSGTVEDGTLATYGDDGVSQSAVVKTGLASKDRALVPNPVTLIPYRTFNEVEQPASSFIFRMKSDKYDGIQCGIFEADGGAWKNVAMRKIKEYLETELADYPMFKIIS